MAGAATGGLLSLRQGAKTSARSAAFGGVLFALIEGARIVLNRFLSNAQNFPPMIKDHAMAMPQTMPAVVGAGVGAGVPSMSSATDESSSSSWLGGFFGGKKKEDPQSGHASGKTEVLEGFDAPTVPTFEFK